MKLTHLVTFNALLAAAAGVAFTLYAPIMLALFTVPEVLEGGALDYWSLAAFARLFGAALFGFGLLNLVRGLVPANAFWLFIVATFLGGPLTSMFGVSIKATMQSIIPPKVQGRIFSLTGSLATAMGPLGLATLGPLADVIGVQPLFLLRGASLLLVALVWAFTSSVRRWRCRYWGAGESVTSRRC